MRLFKTPKIKFLKYKKLALAVTGLIVLAGALNILVGNGLKPGVDFGGGTLVRVMFKDPIPVDRVRQILREVDLGDSVIQESGRKNQEYLIRTQQVIKSADEQQQMEAHEQLGDRVINALSGESGRPETARGLVDLNRLDEKGLAALLEASFPEKGQETARNIIKIRTDNGIIEDFAVLQNAGISPEIMTFLTEKTFLGNLTILSRETVGPQVGKDLRNKALQATIWALIGMLIYIALRFKMAYGVAAIFTLTQDVLITVSIYSFTGREINLPIIAALLTIVGYSINDTIVIFDRVRENSKLMRKEPLEEIMNVSINQTLERTLITSGTVFLTLLALYLFGGEVINDFAFIMLIGTIEGIYSTIYLSCPVVLAWQKVFKTQKGFRK